MDEAIVNFAVALFLVVFGTQISFAKTPKYYSPSPSNLDAIIFLITELTLRVRVD